MRRDLLPWHHHPGHPQVVVPVRIDPWGRRGPTPKAARCGRWRRVGPGWFVPADVDPGATDQRIVEAAVHLTAYGAVTGWAALHWSGAQWFDGVRSGSRRPVVLATGDAGIRAASGLVVSEERLLPVDLDVVDGLRVTRPVRSVLYEMRHARTELEAITALDMACFADLVSIGEVTAVAEGLATWTGIPQVRGALGGADENAWSPTEVAMRWVWERIAGLRRPLANVPVFDLDGRHVLTPDLLDPVAGVGGEYDGEVHRDRGVQARDVRRDDLYRRLGLEQVVMTAPDLLDDQQFVARLHAAYARAAARPVVERTWTIEPRPGWVPTTTVDQRRALGKAERARLLRHRLPGAA